MIIHSAELFRVALPLKHRFQTSSHSKNFIEHVLVRLRDENGVEGWGEIASPSGPYFCSETTDTAWLIARQYLVPAILGREFSTPFELEAAWAKIRGHHFAKSGLSIAAWVLHAQAEGASLASVLGGTRSEVRAGVSLGIEPTIDALLAEVGKHVDAGYPRVKLKIAPGWHIEPVRAVRSVYPDLDLHVDANGGFPADEDAMAIMRQLDELDLTMIEQPFAPRDFVSHARLQQQLRTPICLDEAIEDLQDLETMLALDAGRVLNIKVSRIGGLGSAKAAHDLAREHGTPVWCGGMHEFGIGRAANVAISSLPGFTLPSDVSASDKYYERDVIVPPVTAERGSVAVPVSPGLGHAVDLGWIEANAVERHVERFDVAAGVA